MDKKWTKEGTVTRIDRGELTKLLAPLATSAFAMIEAPFTNPRMFQSTLSNHRSHAEITSVLDDLGILYQVITPHTWQKTLLPGVKGRDELKIASGEKALELYPASGVDELPDGDGLLIAHYLKNL